MLRSSLQGIQERSSTVTATSDVLVNAGRHVLLGSCHCCMMSCMAEDILQSWTDECNADGILLSESAASCDVAHQVSMQRRAATHLLEQPLVYELRQVL